MRTIHVEIRGMMVEIKRYYHDTISGVYIVLRFGVYGNTCLIIIFVKQDKI
jgi:hypothetical protein